MLPSTCPTPGVPHLALTTGSAAWSKQHLEVVFAVLPAFELQTGQQRKLKQNPIILPELAGLC